MTDPIKIGEPIPLGIVDRGTAVLGQDDDAQTNGNRETSTDQNASEQIAALRAEIDALKNKISQAGEHAVSAIRSRPILTATVLSLGLWAIMRVAYRRSDYHVSDVYPALRDRFDRLR